MQLGTLYPLSHHGRYVRKKSGQDFYIKHRSAYHIIFLLDLKLTLLPIAIIGAQSFKDNQTGTFIYKTKEIIYQNNDQIILFTVRYLAANDALYSLSFAVTVRTETRPIDRCLTLEPHMGIF